MFSLQKTSIMIFPENTGKIFQIRVPLFFLRFIIPILLVLIILLSLFIHEYWTVKTRLPVLSPLEDYYEEEERQILYLASRIIQVKQEADKLEGLFPWLEHRSDGREESLPFRPQERSAYTPHDAGYPFSAGMPDLVRLMHQSLDHLDKELGFFRRFVQEGPTSNPASHESNRLEHADEVDTSHTIRSELVTVSRDLGLDPRLAFAMAEVESGFDASRVSPKGAIGVLQVMPKFVLEEHGITREMLFNPKVNIRTGLSIMKTLMDRFDQNLDLSLAAYNAGPSRVIRAGYRIPNIRETRAYVRKVKEAMFDSGLQVYASR